MIETEALTKDFGDFRAVEPDFGPVVDAVEIEPDVPSGLPCGQGELGPIPVGIAPRIPLVRKMAEFREVMFPIEFIR